MAEGGAQGGGFHKRKLGGRVGVSDCACASGNAARGFIPGARLAGGSGEPARAAVWAGQQFDTLLGQPAEDGVAVIVALHEDGRIGVPAAERGGLEREEVGRNGTGEEGDLRAGEGVEQCERAFVAARVALGRVGGSDVTSARGGGSEDMEPIKAGKLGGQRRSGQLR